MFDCHLSLISEQKYCEKEDTILEHQNNSFVKEPKIKINLEDTRLDPGGILQFRTRATEKGFSAPSTYLTKSNFTIDPFGPVRYGPN